MSLIPEFVSPKSISMPSEPEIDIQELPETFGQYKALVHSEIEKKYQALTKTYKAIEQEKEFQSLLNTVPSPTDKVKKFETTYDKAGKLLESFAGALELLGTALLPEASWKLQFRAMVAQKNNKGLRDRLRSDEAKIERNVQVLYNEAKDIALKYNIPTEIIDGYLANEDYVSMDKLIVKARKCKHGLRYNPLTGQVKCIRKREVERAAPREVQPPKPSCFQRRKNDCINTEHCSWEVGKRCKSKAKIDKDIKNAFTTYNNPGYDVISPSPRVRFPLQNNPLYGRTSS